MEFMDIIAILFAGALIGVSIVGIYVWMLYHKLKSRVDQMIKEVIDEAEANIVGLDIEVDNGVYFCYNNKDKQFVCRGNTVGEIAVAFRARYPGKTAYLAGGDPEVVTHFKTELLKLAINENSTSK
jgi:hypothetical protein